MEAAGRGWMEAGGRGWIEAGGPGGMFASLSAHGPAMTTGRGWTEVDMGSNLSELGLVQPSASTALDELWSLSDINELDTGEVGLSGWLSLAAMASDKSREVWDSSADMIVKQNSHCYRHALQAGVL